MKTFFKYTFITACILFSTTIRAQNSAKEINSDSLVAYAKTLIGVPYKYAHSNPKKGFDCSGFVSHVFGKFGLELPRASSVYIRMGTKIDIADTQKGDIIVFTSPRNRNKSRAGHVGIICETGNSLLFIHATSGKAKSVVITPITKHYKERFIKIIRVNK